MRPLLLVIILSSFLLNCLQAQLQWEDTDGPPGSHYLQFYLHGDSTFGFSNNTIFKYTDDNQQWTEIAEESIDFGDSFGDKAIGASVYNQDEVIIKYSTDRSRSWDTLCSFPSDSIYFEDLAVDSSYYYMTIYLREPNNKYVLLRAEHGSCDWDTLTTPEYIKNIKVYDNRLYSFSYSGLYYSDDQGSSWFELHTNPPNIRNFIIDVSAQDSFIFIGKENSVIYSYDLGNNWHTLVTDEFRISSSFTFAGEDAYALINNELFIIENLNINQIQRFPLDRLFYDRLVPLNATIATNVINKGVFRWSKNVNKFIPSYTGINEGYIYDIDFQADTLYAVTAAGLYRYNMKENIWIDKIYNPSVEKETYYVETSKAGWIVLINLHENGFRLSKDWGKTWKFVNHDGIGRYLYERTRPLVVKDTILFFTDYYLGRSSDGGQTIETLSNVHTRKQEVVSFNEKLYIIFNDIIYVSDDLGLKWDSIQLDFEADILIPEDKILIAQKGESFQNYYFHYSTTGTDWFELKLPSNIWTGVGFYPIFWTYEGNLYLSANDTIYITHDHSENWSVFDIHPPNDIISAQDSLLFSYYYGLFRAALPKGTTHAPMVNNISDNFSIQCYPNPSSQYVNVTFNSSKNITGLRLLLVNKKGQIIFSREDESIYPSTRIDVQHFPPGAYFLLAISQTQGISGRKIIIQ